MKAVIADVKRSTLNCCIPKTTAAQATVYISPAACSLNNFKFASLDIELFSQRTGAKAANCKRGSLRPSKVLANCYDDALSHPI
jgi:hypothetical protein